MADFRRGDHDAAAKLVDLFYPELRRLAAARMRRERSDHTWQATALVNELYLELVKVKALRASEANAEAEQQEFLRLSAFLMKRLLIRHARPLSKRAEKTEITDLEFPTDSGADDIAQVDDALTQLQEINPQIRFVVELRVFEGLTAEEIAERLGCGTATVARHWNFSRHWLAQHFRRKPRLES
jgi:RNA polymerase sigma factor (TIGR02999 family)